MLLDETTEGLDATTESQIADLLANAMTRQNRADGHTPPARTGEFGSDNLMDNGHIIEQGSHAELLAKAGSLLPV